MPKNILLDNDIVIKAILFGFWSDVVSFTSGYNCSLTILKVAEFMIRRRINKFRGYLGDEVIELALRDLLGRVQTVEPNDDEIELAADFEASAQQSDLVLDQGESLLLAILIRRGHELMLTGDKRAIRAIEKIASDMMDAARIACFEQVVTTLLQQTNFASLRESICRMPTADRALAICFACSSTLVSVESVYQCLSSYTNDLRKAAPSVLISSNDLSAGIL
jgi:hypothetical protein